MLDGDGQADGEGGRILQVFLHEVADLLGFGAACKNVEHWEDVRRHGAVLDGEVLAVAEEPVADGERRCFRFAAKLASCLPRGRQRCGTRRTCSRAARAARRSARA